MIVLECLLSLWFSFTLLALMKFILPEILIILSALQNKLQERTILLLFLRLTWHIPTNSFVQQIKTLQTSRYVHLCSKKDRTF
jgi:hypothetical protein